MLLSSFKFVVDKKEERRVRSSVFPARDSFCDSSHFSAIFSQLLVRWELWVYERGWFTLDKTDKPFKEITDIINCLDSRGKEYIVRISRDVSLPWLLSNVWPKWLRWEETRYRKYSRVLLHPLSLSLSYLHHSTFSQVVCRERDV
jgi:hypothetical protein